MRKDIGVAVFCLAYVVMGCSYEVNSDQSLCGAGISNDALGTKDCECSQNNVLACAMLTNLTVPEKGEFVCNTSGPINRCELQCQKGYSFSQNGTKCIENGASETCDPATCQLAENARTMKCEKNRCVIDTCMDTATLVDGKCVKNSDLPCDPAACALAENARTMKCEDNRCVIDTCMDTATLVDGKCEIPVEPDCHEKFIEDFAKYYPYILEAQANGKTDVCSEDICPEGQCQILLCDGLIWDCHHSDRFECNEVSDEGIMLSKVNGNYNGMTTSMPYDVKCSKFSHNILPVISACSQNLQPVYEVYGGVETTDNTGERVIASCKNERFDWEFGLMLCSESNAHYVYQFGGCESCEDACTKDKDFDMTYVKTQEYRSVNNVCECDFTCVENAYKTYIDEEKTKQTCGCDLGIISLLDHKGSCYLYDDESYPPIMGNTGSVSAGIIKEIYELYKINEYDCSVLSDYLMQFSILNETILSKIGEMNFNYENGNTGMYRSYLPDELKDNGEFQTFWNTLKDCKKRENECPPDPESGCINYPGVARMFNDYYLNSYCRLFMTKENVSICEEDE